MDNMADPLVLRRKEIILKVFHVRMMNVQLIVNGPSGECGRSVAKVVEGEERRHEQELLPRQPGMAV